jgi:hypothetical protein
MAILTKGQTFANSDAVTSTKLNNLVDAAAFVAGSSGSTDDTSLEVNGSGRLQIKDVGVTSAKLAGSAVTTSKLASSTLATDGVTYAKLQRVANMKAIGNVSGALGVASEVSILDEDDMASDSATSLATQQSIKAYVTASLADGLIGSDGLNGGQTGTAPIFGYRAWVTFDMTRNAAGGSDTANTTRFLIGSGNVASVTKTGTGLFTVAFTTALPNANYAYMGSGESDSGDSALYVNRIESGTKTTTEIQLVCQASGSRKNFTEVALSFIG